MPRPHVIARRSDGMLRWIKRLANKDFHRRSIPDGLVHGLTWKANTHRQNWGTGFQRQSSRAVKAAKEPFWMPVGRAFRKNTDRNSAAKHFSSAFEGGSVPREPRPEHIEEGRARRFPDQQDAFSGPKDRGDAGDQREIPVGKEADEFPSALKGEKNGEKEGFQAGAMVHHHDERVLIGSKTFQTMNIQDIATQETIDQPKQKSAEAARQKRQRTAPDLRQAWRMPRLRKKFRPRKIGRIPGPVGFRGRRRSRGQIGNGVRTRARSQNGSRGGQQNCSEQSRTAGAIARQEFRAQNL